MSNGDVYQAALFQFGIRTRFVKSTFSSQLETYYYDYLNINEHNKTWLAKAVEKLSLYYHKKFEIVYDSQAHFGLSIPARQKQTLWLTNLTQPENKNAITIGTKVDGTNMVIDFNKTPHLLIAGTTGSGKSVLMNTLMTSLYLNIGGNNFELYIIDPKRTEFEPFRKLPNCCYVDNPTNAIALLNNMVGVMEQRYEDRANGQKEFKHIFVVVDELANLMLTSHYDIEETLVQLAAKSRAVNIHLILATQRPTVNVVTGLIKANIDNRICLKMASGIDSRTMLDHYGAEKLIGLGDAIAKLEDGSEIRFQCAMISKECLENYTKGGVNNTTNEEN